MRLKIQTMQGLGDFYWVYRRLAPLVDRIDVDILTLGPEPINSRSVPFLKMFPKVGEVGLRRVMLADYTALVRSVHGISETLRRGGGDFAMDRWLKLGNRLESQEPEYPTDWDFVLADEKIDLPFDREYVVAYVAGTVASPVWTFCQWRLFLQAFQAYDERPFVFVGAEWDRYVLDMMKGWFPNAAFFYHPEPKHLNYILKNASLYIGHESGIGILADAFDVPQIHMAFTEFKIMRDKWCKPGHLESGLFKAFTFDQSPNEVLTGLGIQPGASQ